MGRALLCELPAHSRPGLREANRLECDQPAECAAVRMASATSAGITGERAGMKKREQHDGAHETLHG